MDEVRTIGDLVNMLDLGWWWITEPNPACVNWCERQHEPGEFAQSAIFTCERTVAHSPLYTVRASSIQFASEEDPGRPSRAEEVEVRLEGDGLPVEAVEPFCAALRAAAEVLAKEGAR